MLSVFRLFPVSRPSIVGLGLSFPVFFGTTGGGCSRRGETISVTFRVGCRSSDGDFLCACKLFPVSRPSSVGLALSFPVFFGATAGGCAPRGETNNVTFPVFGATGNGCAPRGETSSVTFRVGRRSRDDWFLVTIPENNDSCRRGSGLRFGRKVVVSAVLPWEVGGVEFAWLFGVILGGREETVMSDPEEGGRCGESELLSKSFQYLFSVWVT